MSIIPDALLDFYLTAKQGQLRMPVFLEHDRGTEERQRRIHCWRCSRYTILADMSSLASSHTNLEWQLLTKGQQAALQQCVKAVG